MSSAGKNEGPQWHPQPPVLGCVHLRLTTKPRSRQTQLLSTAVWWVLFPELTSGASHLPSPPQSLQRPMAQPSRSGNDTLHHITFPVILVDAQCPMEWRQPVSSDPWNKLSGASTALSDTRQRFLGFTNKSIHSSLTVSSRNPDTPTAKPSYLPSSLSFLEGFALLCPPPRSLSACSPQRRSPAPSSRSEPLYTSQADTPLTPLGPSLEPVWLSQHPNRSWALTYTLSEVYLRGAGHITDKG